MKREPDIRRDGRCANPDCRKVIKTITRYGDADAFCSTGCCRTWFGTDLPKPERGVPVGASA
jgi:hypothetical protein